MVRPTQCTGKDTDRREESNFQVVGNLLDHGHDGCSALVDRGAFVLVNGKIIPRVVVDRLLEINPVEHL